MISADEVKPGVYECLEFVGGDKDMPGTAAL